MVQPRYDLKAGVGRSRVLAGGLVAGVALCGAAGVLLAKHNGLRNDPVPAVKSAGKEIEDAAMRKPAAMLPGTKPAPSASFERGPETRVAKESVEGQASQAHTTSEGSPGENAEVGLALSRWRTALLTNDASQIAPLYAAHVNRYFLQTQVDRAFVFHALAHEEERGLRLTQYELLNVTMKPVKNHEVQVDYRAIFTFSTPMRHRTGDARTTLILRQEEGDWKIVYERDFRS